MKEKNRALLAGARAGVWKRSLGVDMAAFRGRMRSIFDRTFPERQIYFRVQGEIEFVTLTARHQLAAFALLALVSGWVAYSTFHYLAFDWMLQASRDDADQGWAAYGRADGERTRLFAERDGLSSRVKDLELNLAVLNVSQEKVLARVADRTIKRIEDVTRLIDMTGLNAERLLRLAAREEGEDLEPLAEDANLNGQGGPFIAAEPGDSVQDGEAGENGNPLSAQVARLDGTMQQWHRVQKVMSKLPLTAPLDSYRFTSGFGSRRDPVNRRWARHLGVDLANRPKTPVLAPAPGRVVSAGRNGRFGRMVEIDHGYGVRTRYGHLHKIMVKPGQLVGFRDVVATLGSSGRSTGPHLHYEVVVDGKPVDPMKFIQAGKFIFKRDPAAKFPGL